MSIDAKGKQVRCAIVGGGLAGFVTFLVLRHGGVEPDEIIVFGSDPDPAATWRRRAESIRQRQMRSESDGHCLPTSFPGLAVREAVRTRKLSPVVRSVLDRYHPSVAGFLEHVDELRQRSGWDASFRRRYIDQVRAVDAGFELPGGCGALHVMLAPGHPGLSFPEELDGDPRVVHAYEPHEYADRVAVFGAGMAAATEWLNALAAGSAVVSIRRREPERRPLNLPRTLFSRRGLAAYHRLQPVDRIAFLRRWLAPSYPRGRVWDEPLEQASRRGRFRVAADIDSADQVICATGFKRGFEHDPLLLRLVQVHRLETAGTWIVLSPESTVPALSNQHRTLALAGAPAGWSFPAADTLAGARYCAHHFLRRVTQCRTR